MAALTLTDSFVYVDDHDFTGYTNEATCTADHEMKPVTVFGSDWEQLIAGKTNVNFAMGGFWEAGAAVVDGVEWSANGTTNRVVTFGPPSNTEGSACYMFQALRTNYTFFGQHGEPTPYSLSAVGSNSQGLVRGYLSAAKQNVSATGAFGTGVQAGAVGATEYLYSTFHVFSAGTTITVVLESDDNAGFTSATTRATIGPITTAGGTWVTRVAGAITDDYYRFRTTAVTGTFSVAGAIGVQ